MALERIDPYATEVPMKVRDTETGAVMMASYDSNANAKIDQLIFVTSQLLTAINGIRARLDAGIKVQQVGSLVNISL